MLSCPELLAFFPDVFIPCVTAAVCALRVPWEGARVHGRHVDGRRVEVGREVRRVPVWGRIWGHLRGCVERFSPASVEDRS